ncbi:MAG: hypothetical protein LBE12_09695 [Planctomycetaceae bacterium]|nr:hypothetical protein [Planctomycetaceae bacterium]
MRHSPLSTTISLLQGFGSGEVPDPAVVFRLTAGYALLNPNGIKKEK